MKHSAFLINISPLMIYCLSMHLTSFTVGMVVVRRHSIGFQMPGTQSPHNEFKETKFGIELGDGTKISSGGNTHDMNIIRYSIRVLSNENLNLFDADSPLSISIIINNKYL